MKSYKTYGKAKFKRDIKTDDWDEIVNEESSPTMLQRNCDADSTGNHTPLSDVKNTEDLTNMEDMLKKLNIDSHSTPVVTPSATPITKNKQKKPMFEDTTPLDVRKYNFKCCRSVSFVTKKNLSLRKRSTGLLSTSLIDCDDSIISNTSFGSQSLKEVLSPVPFRTTEQKILDLCEQDKVIDINEYVMSCDYLGKIGEGSYGEVFEIKHSPFSSLAVKIVPIGSTETLVNGYEQMSFEEIIPEMAISRKLSSLSCDENQDKNHTKGFIQLNRLVFCKGKYPKKLIKLWETWQQDNDCENDHPEIFTDEQHYVIFEQDFGGTDLEKKEVKTFKEAMSTLKQIVAALACAENIYEFEHRDLHHGNILINKTKQKYITTLINNKRYEIETHGLQVSIIDFTMARLITEECVVFTDLQDEKVLFEGQGDIQFEVYRSMKKHNNNEWEAYKPYTNVLWIHYLTEKLIMKISRKATLKKLLTRLLEYESCQDILESDPLFKC